MWHSHCQNERFYKQNKKPQTCNLPEPLDLYVLVMVNNNVYHYRLHVIIRIYMYIRRKQQSNKQNYISMLWRFSKKLFADTCIPFPEQNLVIFFNFDSLTSVSINTSKMSIEKPRNLKLAPLSRGIYRNKSFGPRRTAISHKRKTVMVLENVY